MLASIEYTLPCSLRCGPQFIGCCDVCVAPSDKVGAAVTEAPHSQQIGIIVYMFVAVEMALFAFMDVISQFIVVKPPPKEAKAKPKRK